MNKISDRRIAEIKRLYGEGATIRAIKEAVGVSCCSIYRYVPRCLPERATGTIGPNCCDWCGNLLNKGSDGKRKTPRCKHKFCGKECYGAWKQDSRANDKCSRCGQRRSELRNRLFTQGQCQSCYQVFRDCGFDTELANLHILNQKLKGEARRGKDIEAVIN